MRVKVGAGIGVEPPSVTVDAEAFRGRLVIELPFEGTLKSPHASSVLGHVMDLMGDEEPELTSGEGYVGYEITGDVLGGGIQLELDPSFTWQFRYIADNDGRADKSSQIHGIIRLWCLKPGRWELIVNAKVGDDMKHRGSAQHRMEFHVILTDFDPFCTAGVMGPVRFDREEVV